jgi:hypothetical protein
MRAPARKLILALVDIALFVVKQHTMRRGFEIVHLSGTHALNETTDRKSGEQKGCR